MFRGKKWAEILAKEQRAKQRKHDRNKGKNKYPKNRMRPYIKGGCKLISDIQCWHLCPHCKKDHCHPNKSTMMDAYELLCNSCKKKGIKQPEQKIWRLALGYDRLELQKTT